MRSLGMVIKAESIQYVCLEGSTAAPVIYKKEDIPVARHNGDACTMVWAEEKFDLIISSLKPNVISYVFSLCLERQEQLLPLHLQGILELSAAKSQLSVNQTNKLKFIHKQSAFWRHIGWKSKHDYINIVNEAFPSQPRPWNDNIRLATACAWLNMALQ